jgi:hypothetical protein
MTDANPAPAKRPRRRTAAKPVAVGPGPASADQAPMEASDAEPVETSGSTIDARNTTLRLGRGGIAEATAGNVEVSVGGIGALDAEEVFVQWGGIGAARADRLGVEFGAIGAALAGEARVTQGIAGSVAARDAILEQSLVRTLIAQRVTVNRPTGVLVMIAQQVSGEVRPLLDWRGALVAGAAFGLVTVLARAIRGRA